MRQLTHMSFNIFIFLCVLFLPSSVLAQGSAALIEGLPALSVSSDQDGQTTYSLSLQILALMTALTVLPSLVLGMTSFTRIIIVLSILRQAMGTQQTPPNQVLIAIALFLSFFIMTPTFNMMNEQVLTPYLDGQMPAETALEDGSAIMKKFMVRNTRKDDLTMFAEMAGESGYERASGCAFFDCFTCLYHLGIKDGFPNWLSTFPSIPGHRYGHCFHSYVIGYDDVESYACGFTI